MRAVENYTFSAKAEERFKKLETQFPERESLVLWALHLVQEDAGYIPPSAISYVAERVGVSRSHVQGVISFYAMFHDKPMGKFHLQVCVNASCWLAGSDELEKTIENHLQIRPGETTPDGLFTYNRQGECLASCGTAPVVQINADYHESMTPQKLETLIEQLKRDS